MIFGNDAVLTPDEVAYTAYTSTYWSQQQGNVDPRCVFLPEKASDISVLVLISRLTQCSFAARSGGHAAFKGASNSESGVTVSFQKMKAVTLSSDKKSVKIQPGNTWSDVYTTLDPSGVTVTGGRVASVGTGGLTLGGELHDPCSKRNLANPDSQRRHLLLLQHLRLGL